MLDSLLKSEFVAKVAESDWVKKNITRKAITLQLQVGKFFAVELKRSPRSLLIKHLIPRIKRLCLACYSRHLVEFNDLNNQRANF
jgi:hypothetical protein